MLEGINSKLDDFSSTIKDQLHHNKQIETRLAHLAAALPFVTNPEQVKPVTTRGGKSTRDPSYPLGTTRRQATTETPTATKEKNDDEVKELDPSIPEMTQDFHDSNIMPFPRRKRKAKVDEQFNKFVEVIQKLYINVPLLDAIQVPTYARYIWDILNNKRPLPTTEVIKLTEEYSAAILNMSPKKKKDPGCPTIDCTIRSLHFDNALCDLGASVSVVPNAVFDKLPHAKIVPTSMCLQLANQSLCYPMGIAKDILARMREFIIPVDFVVLDMHLDSRVSLILGRPFLSTANAHIDVGIGEVKFNINGKEERFPFRPRPELNLKMNNEVGDN
jgi:hypothetical protein